MTAPRSSPLTSLTRPDRRSSTNAGPTETVRRFLPDTSCIIPLVCGWHEDHPATISEFQRRLDAGEQLIVAGHCMAETYAVLTRLLPPHRLAPKQAAELVRRNLVDTAARVVALDGRGYVTLIRDAVESGVAGGRIYDAAIAATAVRARVQELLTLNVRDFTGLLPDTIEVVAPRTAAR